MSVRAPHDVVRALFEARADGDVRHVLALLDPAIRAQALTGGEVAEGIGAVRGLFGRESATGPRVELEAHRFERDGEDGVRVFGRVRVIDRGSLSDSPGAWHFTVRGGRVVAMRPLDAAPPALRRVA